MRYLLKFLIKYNYWFLFIFLELIAFALLVRFNTYQRGAFFTSANVVVGRVYQFSGKVTSYFHLKSTNENLLDRNIMLEQRISYLENTLKHSQADSMALLKEFSSMGSNYDTYKAYVIKNSINRADNYITLDKGASDGIKPEMGVVDGRGVVGIVYLTSSHYSVVISVLNSKSNISCKIKSSDYFGYLRWEGSDSRFASLKDLPRHASFALGDTVITSGNSAVFPEGVMIGVVDDFEDSNDGLSFNVKIKLSTDFGKLSGVRVLSRHGQEEQRNLEDQINKVKNSR